MIFRPDAILEQQHRTWLKGFDPQYLRNWEKVRNADIEAAMCEAAVRRLLEANGNKVEPNEDLNGSDRSPDFRCTRDEQIFFTEVKNISIEQATEITALSHFPQDGAYSFGLLNKAIWNVCKEKTPQCARLGYPALVAVGTFHFRASCLCFQKRYVEMLLTGEELITANIDE